MRLPWSAAPTVAAPVVDTTARDVRRTAQTVTAGQWGVAAVVMAGSAASGGLAFEHLGEHWGIGVVTGLGVDLALATGLIVDRRLRAVGLTTVWGAALRWITAVMTLILNSGVSALTGHVALAFLHAFLPIVLVILTEAGAEAQLKLLRLQQEKEADEQAERDAQAAEERARWEADQAERAAARRAEDERLERIRKDQAAQREREAELARERAAEAAAQRDHERGQAAATLAAALWMSRRPSRRVSQRRPSRPSQPRPNRGGGTRPKSVPVTDELLDRARRWRDEQAAAGQTAGWSRLASRFGLPERAAKEVVRRLRDEPVRPHLVRAEA